ncbi:VanZ family protein [Aquirufa echingensis]|jgi:glycopeptide antibiotics resistance protein|uniref:VanZ family protein n=1 Tax=Aquirufa echingensis TaxID=3096516 RepID=A0ABW6D372_9BACT
MKIFTRTLIAFYLLLLIKFVVFKDLDMILVGHMRFYFGGTQTGDPNWIPFKTIASYFMGNKGLLIVGLNLAGNLLLLAPIGFLIPAGFPDIRRNTIFMLALCTSLSIEIIQHIFQIGFFDIDDVLLNSLGFILGYYFCALLPGNWQKAFTLMFSIILLGLLLYYLSHSVPMNPMPLR